MEGYNSIVDFKLRKDIPTQSMGIKQAKLKISDLPDLFVWAD
jgi:hypothetical protein